MVRRGVMVAAMVGGFGVASARAEGPVTLGKPVTIDVPGLTAEIVQYVPSQRLLLTTNPLWKTLDVFDVASLDDPPAMTPLDFDDLIPGEQGFSTVRGATSVAAHPALPIALVAVPGYRLTDRGSVIGFDLRRGGRLGAWVVNQEVGVHPDSIAISPDGAWALVACEAEGDPLSEGSIWAMDLRGLTPDTAPRDGALPAFELPGLKKLLRRPAGVLEPEFVAFDPRGRFAVVSLQENNAFVTVDLSPGSTPESTPKLAGVTTLGAEGASPDGVSVLDGVMHEGREGCLVAVAEEGELQVYQERWLGNAVSLHWVDPAHLDEPAVELARVDLRPLIDPGKPEDRRDPESVLLTRHGGRSLCFVTVERGDWLLCLDVTEPAQPTLIGKVRTGDRPEGVTLARDGEGLVVITANEGNEGGGDVTFVRVGVGEKAVAAGK